MLNTNDDIIIREPLIFYLFLLFALSLSAEYSLFQVDWFSSHEEWHSVQRVYALSNEIRNGDWYPRWLSLAYHGSGSPMFNYYAPGIYLITAYLHVLGLPLLFAIKFVILLILFIGSVGIFFWVRRYTTLSGAYVAASVYMYLPYHFLDLYIRNAFSEFAALAFIPYLFFGIDLLLAKQSSRGLIFVALSSASIVIVHNLTAVMVLPFAVVYFGIQSIHYKIKKDVLGISLAATFVGGLLSGFYWLPVLLEKEFIPPFGSTILGGYYHYSNHFVCLSQLIDTAWGNGWSLPSCNDGMSYQIGIVPLVVLLIGLRGYFRLPSQSKYFVFSCLLLGLCGLTLTLPISKHLYELVPVFQFVQFPWRFLGISTFFLVAASSMTGFLDKKYRPYPLVVFVTVLLLFTSIPQRTIVKPLELTNDWVDQENGVAFSGGLTERDEFLPKWSSKALPISTQPIADSPRVTIQDVEIHGSHMSFRIKAPNNISHVNVVVPWHYFPGWNVIISGEDRDIFPDENGFIKFLAPPGESDVEIYFGTTKARITGWVMTTIGVVLLLILWWSLTSKETSMESVDKHIKKGVKNEMLPTN